MCPLTLPPIATPLSSILHDWPIKGLSMPRWVLYKQEDFKLLGLELQLVFATKVKPTLPRCPCGLRGPLVEDSGATGFVRVIATRWKHNHFYVLAANIIGIDIECYPSISMLLGLVVLRHKPVAVRL